jgi:hypothetical protein
VSHVWSVTSLDCHRFRVSHVLSSQVSSVIGLSVTGLSVTGLDSGVQVCLPVCLSDSVTGLSVTGVE